ncbi:MAG: hypothetical protein HY943_09720 [Gammaproteobacteria bacterium]|nr:hypothetical protein [Gammaproteobacteria bacterium]
MKTKYRLAIAALGLGLLMSAAQADSGTAREAFASGVEAFNAKRFEAAVTSFEQASATVPQSAEYQHWLGRAYGRLAEQSSWLRATELARKTCAAFERAHALDPNDVGTVEDLIEYYTEAPAFLGGGSNKAAAMKRYLEQLQQGAARTVSVDGTTALPAR